MKKVLFIVIVLLVSALFFAPVSSHARNTNVIVNNSPENPIPINGDAHRTIRSGYAETASGDYTKVLLVVSPGKDWYGRYPGGSVSNPKGPSSGKERVMRGGHWGSEADGCRSAKRYRFPPNIGSDAVGFRLVMRP